MFTQGLNGKKVFVLSVYCLSTFSGFYCGIIQNKDYHWVLHHFVLITYKCNEKKDLRIVAIDSRTSNPYVHFMEKWKGIMWGDEFVTGLISEVPIFFFFLFFCKATCRLQTFHLSEVEEKGIYKKCWKRQIPSSIKKNMNIKQTLQNEDLCYFQNSGIDQLSYFNF